MIFKGLIPFNFLAKFQYLTNFHDLLYHLHKQAHGRNHPRNT